MSDWDMAVDVLVVGAGGAGMVAAIVAHDLGAQTLLIEKSSYFGGTTAMSGGALWVPNHPLMAEHGIQDSPEAALTYLRAITRGEVEDELLQAYVTHAPRMLAYLLEHTHYRARPMPHYPDYYPDAPGGLPGGRTLDPEPFAARALGADAARLRPPHPQELVFGRVMLTAGEAHAAVTGGIRGMFTVGRHIARYLFTPKGPNGRDGRLTLGNALVARLYLSLKERGIPLWLETRLDDLVMEGRRVVGAVITSRGQRLHVRVRRGVILTAGGFARSAQLRARFHPQPSLPEWTAAAETDTGDVLLLAEKVGAATTLLDQAWWNPVTLVPGSPYAWLLVIEKGLPGAILVDRFGERFVNESAPYLDVGRAMYTPDREGKPRVPAFLIMDARNRRRYPCGPLLPARFQPWWAVPARLRDVWIARAATLEELARQVGIDPDGLVNTVTRFNEHARRGEDPDFGRGASVYDRYYADPSVQPNPSLAPLEHPPFYAIRVYPGDLGTKGGMRITPWGQVRHRDGGVIEGLYAAGNSAASPMGPSYPGAGGTLGPAFTFAYLAARHVMGNEEAL